MMLAVVPSGSRPDDPEGADGAPVLHAGRVVASPERRLDVRALVERGDRRPRAVTEDLAEVLHRPGGGARVERPLVLESTFLARLQFEAGQHAASGGHRPTDVGRGQEEVGGVRRLQPRLDVAAVGVDPVLVRVDEVVVAAAPH